MKTAVEQKKVAIQTWLISHLSEKTLIDVRGKQGVKKIRSEIKDDFNQQLFKTEDGKPSKPLIDEVLFDEYHVQ